jgi:SRSO17 transposase
MKPPQNTTPESASPSLQDLVRWSQALRDFHLRIAPHFARPQPREHARLSLQALLSAIPRKNGWQVAAHARQARPYGIQRLLSKAVWDADRVRDEVRQAVLEALGRGEQDQGTAEDAKTISPVMGVDETSFPKRGKGSAGVQKQSCGTTARLEN